MLHQRIYDETRAKKPNWKLDLSLLSYGCYKCMFVDVFNYIYIYI